MNQVKSQENKGSNVKDYKGQHFKLIYDFACKIVEHNPIHNDLGSMTKFGFDIKVHHMDHQEDQGDYSRVNHEFGEERSVRVVGLVVPAWPGNPVLNLENQGIDDVQQEASKQDNFEDLDQDV